ncbi:hypothetical protein YQE_12886, partial [Dendroctonus ponderosae]
MAGNLDSGSSKRSKSKISQIYTRLSQIHQAVLDKWAPNSQSRWLSTTLLLLLFVLRVFLTQSYQGLLDKTVPWVKARWLFGIKLVIVFLARILLTQGWYIVAYALGIYHLNLFISFLTPKMDPALDFDAEENGPELPMRANEEFRPFIRRLPEFKFWYSMSVTTCIALICTFFDCLNVPVFWPILVMYFITLFCITMKRQIMHMIKYRYLPFTHGKPKYQTNETGKSSKRSPEYVKQFQQKPVPLRTLSPFTYDPFFQKLLFGFFGADKGRSSL